MASEFSGANTDLSRRAFLSATGSALASAAVAGLPSRADAAQPRPGRGGTLRFATRMDVTGLDPHRNVVYPVSMPLAATSQGLVDLNRQSEPVPGVAVEWDAAPDLRTYTFKLRQGVLFHNGREVDAAAVKWNFERMRNPQTSHAFPRSALNNLKEVVAVDKYTVRCRLHASSAAFPANVVYYPCSLMAPDSEAHADTHPIGCGPFKFVRWERYRITEMERFANYFETDASGQSLPYLDGIVGLPKREESGAADRLTHRRGGLDRPGA
jgi:peptide/nickel transport system substrate-binding protein